MFTGVNDYEHFHFQKRLGTIALGFHFQGRYKALLVDKNAYGAVVSRYIHLNPVRVAAGRKQTVARAYKVKPVAGDN